MVSQEQIKAVYEAIQNASRITVLTHIHPDADTLGAGLGIYTLLKEQTNKNVEICNASTDLPTHLKFLPYFAKIKHQIDFNDSLIITCDAGSINRLGFEIEGREIINIDHHKSNTRYGSINIVDPDSASTSQVALTLFEPHFAISKECATAFYTALTSDTRYFTTSSVNAQVFDLAAKLCRYGCDAHEVAKHLTQQKALASLRILSRALASLRLFMDGEIAAITVSLEDIEATGALMPDIEGIVDYTKSLATVRVAILIVELPGGVYKVSLRSKDIDIDPIAGHFGGGGHKHAAGFEIKAQDAQSLLQEILEKLSKVNDA